MEPTWPERGDSTQVFPSSWTPPEPASREPSDELEPVAGRVRTALAEPEPDVMAEVDVDEEPSTAEQAVPWLIGFILLLVGMVILLLALIFAGDASFGSSGGLAPSVSGVAEVPSPSATAVPPTPSDAASASAAPSTEPTATPIPLPEYGALEMIYQGRRAALAPIYLLLDDFTTPEDPSILAQDPNLDVRHFAWAPQGTLGAGLLADVLVSIEPGAEKRPLGTGIATITFGNDATTIYGVRVSQDGANEVATVLAIDFATGDTTELASPRYPRPTIGTEDDLAEAQFADDGGTVRLYWLETQVLRLWVLGAGTWDIAPDDGQVTELEADAQPVLWAPDGERRIRAARDGAVTTITALDAEGTELAATTIEGRVSHLRWSPDGRRAVFTLGRLASGGGVLQDLFLWDLNEEPPMQLTSTGAAFGAEWRGSQPRWRG